MEREVAIKGDSIKNVVFDLGGVLIAWKPDEIIASIFDAPDLQAVIKREVFQHPDWLELLLIEYAGLQVRLHPTTLPILEPF